MADDNQIAADGRTVASNIGIDSVQDAEKVFTPEGKMDRAEALLYEHPDYEEYIQKWTKYADCYLARDLSKYVTRHPREHEDTYKARLERLYYYNYVASIVDLFVSYLFQSGINRTINSSDPEVKSIIDEILEDATRQGMNYNLFVDIAATFAQIYGHIGILVDMPRTDQKGMTVEERKKAKHRPYLQIFHPHQLLDWEMDDVGQFEWIKLEIGPPSGRQWDVPVADNTRYFVIWDKQKWTKYAVQDNGEKEEAVVTVLGEGEHKLGIVPFAVIRNEHSLAHDWFGESAIRDISDINISILNWCSFSDEEIANRCLNILVMQRDENDKAIEISHYNVLEYPEGANAPQYLTPGETPLKLIQEQINQARDEIYRIAKMGGSTGLLGVREATSGIAYAFEFNETNQSLARKAEFMEQGEKDIWRCIAAWLQKDIETIILYPREFGVDDFLSELRILLECRTTLTSTTAIKEREKKLLNKMFCKEKQALRETMMQEVDNGPSSKLIDDIVAEMNWVTASKRPEFPVATKEEQGMDKEAHDAEMETAKATVTKMKQPVQPESTPDSNGNSTNE